MPEDQPVIFALLVVRYRDNCVYPHLTKRLQMDNVLVDMVERLRAIELLLRTQNELLSKVIAELEQIRHGTEDSDPEKLYAAAESLKQGRQI